MTNKINRRNFFLQAGGVKKLLSKKDKKYHILQDVKYEISIEGSEVDTIIFYVGNSSCLQNKINLPYVSFLEDPFGKTDIFFDSLLKKNNVAPTNRYIITDILPDKSSNFWDKIIWITKEIPQEIPKINCPILIVQDIENFDASRSPAELLPMLAKKSDIFIAQRLDLSSKNNPATKRVYDFLNE